MVRQRVMGLGHADLRVRPSGLFAAVHERDHARQVRLIREQLQIVEELHVRLEAVGHSGGPVDLRTAPGALLLRFLDAAFDVAERL